MMASPDASLDTNSDEEEPVPGTSEGNMEECPEVARGSKSGVERPSIIEQLQEGVTGQVAG